VKIKIIAHIQKLVSIYLSGWSFYSFHGPACFRHVMMKM